MSHHHDPTRNIKIAFFLNLSFTLFEIGGGLWTNSVAILSEALHDLGDTVALGLSWYFAEISQKKADSQFSYGYQRYSLIGALISSIVLLLGSVAILFETVPRIFSPEEVHVKGMIFLAAIGFFINGVAALKVWGGKTQNERMVLLHLLEDTLGWLAMLVAAIVMLFTKLAILDPILSICITLYILWYTFKNLRNTINIFLQATPSNIKIKELEAKLLKELPIHSSHAWHLWTMDGDYHVLSCHIVVDNDLSAEKIIFLKKQIREILKQHHIKHITIEIEYEKEFCEFVDV
jgi:cobalt-zinc-cadmium efflux system protein